MFSTDFTILRSMQTPESSRFIPNNKFFGQLKMNRVHLDLYSGVSLSYCRTRGKKSFFERCKENQNANTPREGLSAHQQAYVFMSYDHIVSSSRWKFRVDLRVNFVRLSRITAREWLARGWFNSSYDVFILCAPVGTFASVVNVCQICRQVFPLLWHRKNFSRWLFLFHQTFRCNNAFTIFGITEYTNTSAMII